MQDLEKVKKKSELFFKRYPFLKSFEYRLKLSPDDDYSSFLRSKFNPEANSFNSICPQSLMQLDDFIDDDCYRIKKYLTKDFETFCKNTIVNQDKYKKLFIWSLKELDTLYIIHDFVLSKLLVDLGFNSDLVFNYLQRQLEKNKNNETDGDFGFSSWGEKPMDFDIVFLKRLKENLSEKKVLKLVFSYFGDFSNYLDCKNLFEDARKDYLDFDWKDFLDNNYDHKFDRLHNNLSIALEYCYILKQVDNHSLKQREDFLKMEGQVIEVNGEKLKINVPLMRYDLVEYSKIFSNCIGRTEKYATDCVNQKVSIIGLFTLENKPRYCICTEKYSFTEAKGVHNSIIPHEVFLELQKLITLKPKLPEQFIALSDHFIQGYKYNPEEKSLFILFKQNPDVIYEYHNVNNEVYEEFSKVGRKGAYLNMVIKKHDYDKIIIEQ